MKLVKEIVANGEGTTIKIKIEGERSCEYELRDFKHDFSQITDGIFLALTKKFYIQDIKIK